MNSMIERVARAIFEAWASNEVTPVATWEELVEANSREGFPEAKKTYRLAFLEARAAIEAMKPFHHRLIDNAYSWSRRDQFYLGFHYMDQLIDKTLDGMKPEEAKDFKPLGIREYAALQEGKEEGR